MSDFWEKLSTTFQTRFASSADRYLKGTPFDGEQSQSVKSLTDKERAKQALFLPVNAGTRVRFAGGLGALLTYEDIPADHMEGVVVTVRSASGDITAFNEKVFVLWDDQQFRPIHRQFLRKAKRQVNKNAFEIQFKEMGDMYPLFKTASNGDLVHKATEDLWSLEQTSDGYVLKRLFAENGKPLKV